MYYVDIFYDCYYPMLMNKYDINFTNHKFIHVVLKK